MKQPNLFRKLLRPEVLLVLLAVFFYIRQLMAGKEGYDIHFHDTYYVIQWPWWFAPGPMILLLLAFIYWLTRNFRQLKSLQYFHVLSFVVFPVLTWMLLFFALAQTAFLANLAIGFIRGKKSPVPVQ